MFRTRFRMSTALASWVAFSFASGSFAAPVPGLFNTGVNGAGAPLADGAVDPHYTLVSSADPNYPGPSAYASNPIPSGFWVANSATSRWIGPAVNEGYPSGAPAHPAGTYAFRLVVDLNGFDPGTVEIHGTWAADNGGSIRLNGNATGLAVGGYATLVPFSITSGFVTGMNMLDFVVTNAPSGGANPTGVRVNGLAGSGNAVVSVLEGTDVFAFGLAAPYPNPARETTRIDFTLPRAGTARLVVRDLAGRTVRTLLDGSASAGRFESAWDGSDANGSRAGAGVYFVELEAEGRRESRRIVLMR